MSARVRALLLAKCRAEPTLEITIVVEILGEIVFELGKLLLKAELSKKNSVELLRSLGGGETETIVLQKIGKFWNQQKWLDRPDGLVIVTTHRFVFLSKVKTITTKTDFLSIPFEALQNLRTTRVMLVSPAIQFEVLDKTFVFTFLSNAEEVREAIERGANLGSI